MTISTPLRLTLGCALLALASSPAGAQQPARPDTVRLDTLTVQVLRTPLPAVRAPYAVSVVTEREIRLAQPGLALDRALRAIPGVQVDNRYNYALGERISIRGFGARAQFGVRGVRVLLDDIPATLPDGQTTLNHVDPGALERVEVVRGPAAALYGNASGGVIRLTTLEPPTAPFASEYRVVGGADGLLRLQSTVGGRARGFRYLAKATRLRYDGFREYAEADNTQLSARLGWAGGDDDVRLALDLVDYDARNPGSLSDSLLRVDRRQAFANNVRQATGETGRQGQVGASWRRALRPGVLEMSAYGITRAIDNPIPNRVIDLARRAGGVRAAFSSSPGVGWDALRWTAGAELQAQRDDRENYANQGGERGALALDQRERVAAASGFAQGTLVLGERVDVLAALRYDRHRFRVEDRFVTDDADDSGARTMDAWSPTVGISLRAADAAVLYANVATAFETPTTTELANRPDGAGGFNPELEPQRTLSYEAGVKGTLGPAASYTLAAYRARVRDALIPFEVEGAPGRQFFRNAGSARHQGVEASLAWITGPFVARAAYTWTDARFRDYVVDGTDFGGNRIPGIAPHRVEAALTLGTGTGPFVGVDGRYLAATEVDDANRFRSPSYAVFDLRAGWEELRVGRFRASPFVGIDNLLGREYNTSVVVNAFGRRYFEPGPGRTLYAGVRVGGWSR